MNNQRNRLPLSLGNNVVIRHSGLFAYVSTDFLKLYYDWNSAFILQLSNAYQGKVQGMCGPYQTLSGAYTPKETPLPQEEANALGQMFATPQSDKKCWNNCHGLCEPCPDEKRETYEENCAILTAPRGPFSPCHDVIDPRIFFEYCVNDQCLNNGAKQMMCTELRSYVAICQKNGVKLGEWRRLAGCRKYKVDKAYYVMFDAYRYVYIWYFTKNYRDILVQALFGGKASWRGTPQAPSCPLYLPLL